MKARLYLIVFGALVLGSCMVGPKYARPTVPMTPAYKELPPEAFKEANGWKPAQPDDQAVRAKWWEVFGDPQLNSLEEQVDLSNQDLKAAEARFREARAIVRFNRAAQFPTITTGPEIGALRNSANRPGLPSNIGSNTGGNFVLPFDLSYELDLYGAASVEPSLRRAKRRRQRPPIFKLLVLVSRLN